MIEREVDPTNRRVVIVQLTRDEVDAVDTPLPAHGKRGSAADITGSWRTKPTRCLAEATSLGSSVVVRRSVTRTNPSASG